MRPEFKRQPGMTAPASPRPARWKSLLALASLLAALTLLAPAGAAASVPSLFTSFPEVLLTGESAGRLNGSSGIAAQAGPPGHLYVADIGNNRIDVFNPWGQFIESFGWGVRDGAGEAQVCTAESGCREGLRGSGAGEFDRPGSVALDSAGNLYVTDAGNPRVQKFDPQGNFLLGFGWGVRDGSEEAQTCGPEASPPTATCLAGVAGGGAGQVSSSYSSGRLAVDTKGTASAADDAVFLADGERIEKFSSAGAYDEEIKTPGRTISSIAVDAEGKLYASFGSGPELNVIRKLRPSGPEAEFISPKFETDGKFGGGLIAVDGAGNLYSALAGQELGLPKYQPARILEFDANGQCLVCGSEGEGGEEGFDRSEVSTNNASFDLSGIASTAACGSTDVYVSHNGRPYFQGPRYSFVNIFGPHPDTTLCPPPKLPPSIEASYAASVDTEEAELRAQINPHYWADTAYFLEYGTAPCSEGGCRAIPAPPGRLLSKAVTGAPVSAPIFLAGLQPRTTYHYRFVASGSGSEGQPVRGTGGTVGADGAEGTFTTFAPTEPQSGCANDAYRTGPGAYLPDCRAYELVSPLGKANGNVVPNFLYNHGFHDVPAGLEQSALSGDRLAYSSATAFADAVSSPWTSQYIAERIAGSEWRTHAITPPQGRLLGLEEGIALLGHDTEFRVFSPDLCDSWLRTVTDLPLAAGAVPGSTDLYRREDGLCAPGGAGGYEALTTVAPADGYLGLGLELQGVSADGTTALFGSGDGLPGTGSPAALQGKEQLYVRGAGGQTRFACVLPGGAKVSCLAGTTFGGETGFSNYWASLAGVVASDGSRIFWSTPALGGGTIYLRQNPLITGAECAGVTSPCTIPVSAEGQALSGTESSRFLAAAEDGSRAIFLTQGKAVSDLYEFDLASRSTHKIAGRAAGILGASADASVIYFLSEEAIEGAGDGAPGASAEGQPPQAGEQNLYRYEAGAGGGAYRFIAPLAADDAELGAGEASDPSPVSSAPVMHDARVGADGRHLAFTSLGRPTGYDNTDQGSGEAATEAYVYDASANGSEGRLLCASCNPSGARPAGARLSTEGRREAARVPGWENSFYASRALAADGERLFFESYDALVPRDTNGAQDIYEWEAPGAGSCGVASSAYSSRNGGCISLISSGTGARDAEFRDADPSGANVFFGTLVSLLPQDYGLVDVYDARVEGGLPGPVTAPPDCEGEACQSPPQAPNDPTPASSAFEGAGNVVAPTAKPCPKGKVRKHGKCLPKHHKKTHKHHKKTHERHANHDRKAAR